MKKLFALVLSAVLMVSCLAGCSSGGKKSSGTNSKDSAIQLYIKYLTGEASKSEIKKMKPQYFWEISDESPEDIYEEMKEDPEYPMDMLKEYYGKNVKQQKCACCRPYRSSRAFPVCRLQRSYDPWRNIWR